MKVGWKKLRSANEVVCRIDKLKYKDQTAAWRWTSVRPPLPEDDYGFVGWQDRKELGKNWKARGELIRDTRCGNPLSYCILRERSTVEGASHRSRRDKGIQILRYNRLTRILEPPCRGIDTVDNNVNLVRTRCWLPGLLTKQKDQHHDRRGIRRFVSLKKSSIGCTQLSPHSR